MTIAGLFYDLKQGSRQTKVVSIDIDQNSEFQAFFLLCFVLLSVIVAVSMADVILVAVVIVVIVCPFCLEYLTAVNPYICIYLNTILTPSREFRSPLCE